EIRPRSSTLDARDAHAGRSFSSQLWTLAFEHHEDRTPTYGCEPTREAAMAAFSTAVRLSAPGAVRHDVANQVAHVVLQISDDVLDDVSHRDHAHDLARVQHW